MAHGGKRPGTGGKRPGAGRKKGAATKKTRKVANEVASDGEVTPLEVMIEAMRGHHKAGRIDRAAEIAKDAAPYVHPRLAAVTHKGDQAEPVRLVEEVVIVDGSQAPAPAAPGASGVHSQ